MIDSINTSFKGAVFDLDGTIIDSLPFWDNMNKEFFAEYCADKEVDESRIRGMSIKMSVDYIVDELGVLEKKETLIQDIKDKMTKAYFEEIPIKKGADKLIRNLRSRGVPLSVCTACDITLAKGALRRLNLIDYFDHIVSTHELQMDKSNTDVYELMSEKMGIPTADLAMFEDTYRCMKAANEAGMKVIAIEDKGSVAEKHLIEKIADDYLIFS